MKFILKHRYYISASMIAILAGMFLLSLDSYSSITEFALAGFLYTIASLFWFWFSESDKVAHWADDE